MPIIDIKKHRYIGVVDMVSGEMLGEYDMGSTIKSEGEWIRLYQRAAVEMSTRSYSGAVFRVYFYMLGNVGYGNASYETKTWIAKQTGLSRKSVTSALDVLEGDKIVTSHKRKNGDTFYRLNPNFAWKGDKSLRHIAIQAA